jgi:hypothetical protein
LIAVFSGFIIFVGLFGDLPKKCGKIKKLYQLTNKKLTNLIIKFYIPNQNKNTNYNSLDGV